MSRIQSEQVKMTLRRSPIYERTLRFDIKKTHRNLHMEMADSLNDFRLRSNLKNGYSDIFAAIPKRKVAGRNLHLIKTATDRNRPPSSP